MKKLVLFAALCLMTGATAFAQDYKAKAGSKTFEFILAPDPAAANFVGAFTNSIKQPYMRGRWFMSDAMAIRGGLQLGMNGSTTYDGQENKTEVSSTNIAIRPGVEWHFAGNSRFSPYWGVEAAIGIMGASEKQTDKDGKNIVTIDGATNAGARGGMMLGVNGVLGADYYITDMIYLGVEGTWGYSMMTNSDVKTKNGDAAEVTTKGGGNSGLGHAVGQIRFGFRF